MNNRGSMGIASMALISTVLVVGASSSIMFEDSDELAESVENLINDTLNEITSYLKIEETFGKYYNSNGERRVERILIFVKQFITSNVNISDLTIKIQNDNDIMMLSYSGYATKVNSSPLFSHEIWDKTNNSFSVIVNIDTDRSILDYNIMNKDTCYFVIDLPEQFFMKNKDSLIVSIIPGKGTTSSVILETPSMHLSNIITF